ncbi:unnamed protein product [Lactuca saligna]|uniref:Uncharacterized protein n=1 Tax=Lactuca saligna TaxID=75948 RepID=A0AA36EJS5_LACSI|nr:unnamed protein product [Lactuca saligna]
MSNQEASYSGDTGCISGYFHTVGSIVVDKSKFSFVGSILEARFLDVPTSLRKGGKKWEKTKGDQEGPSAQTQTPNKGQVQTDPPAPKRRKVKKPSRKSMSPTPIGSEHS